MKYWSSYRWREGKVWRRNPRGLNTKTVFIAKAHALLCRPRGYYYFVLGKIYFWFQEFGFNFRFKNNISSLLKLCIWFYVKFI